MQYNFRLTDSIVPKARPRIGSKGAYLPERYRDWKNQAIIELTMQMRPINAIERCAINIEIGKVQRGDLDNIAGSILDALVQSGILLDDRISCVYRLSIEHNLSAPNGAKIEITI
jgi:Holliday junction resolvase RusA-like endonuclease